MQNDNNNNLPKRTGRFPWKKENEKSETKKFWDPTTGYYTVVINGKVYRYVSEKEYLETQQKEEK